MIRAHGQTDIGRLRKENQDGFLADEAHRVFAVADGVGGLPGGAEASRAALETLARALQKLPAEAQPEFDLLFEEINAAVLAVGQTIDSRLGIGTTLALVQVHDDSTLTVAHVGDSCLFRLRGGSALKLTLDHTVENERPESAPAQFSPTYLQALTRCIGQELGVQPDVQRHPIEAGDRYLLCTDGISKALSVQDLESILQNAPDPQSCVRNLIDESNHRGGVDNATGIALFF